MLAALPLVSVAEQLVDHMLIKQIQRVKLSLLACRVKLYLANFLCNTLALALAKSFLGADFQAIQYVGMRLYVLCELSNDTVQP